ncbi:MAG: hypothetical protein HY961_12000, partial [Ignavibacteriae bacterium]|nr:hypothetical protein [Ignavibacteriota bacterium]
LKHNLQERDQYIDDVMRSINEVYASLEEARTKEGKLTKGAGSEGPITFRNATSREAMVNNINEIGTTLKENRKRIVGLQQSIRKYNGKIKSLNDMVENLQHSLEEREQAIASFESRVQGLEADVATKTQTITEREAVISDQLKTINTAFYVIGTRDELEQKGIITDEGGFLGFIGSTTIMASGIDQSAFTPIDRTSAQTIEVKGEIDEILPPRKETFYTRTENSDQSQLSITQPERFWQDKYLVIVVDEPQISEVRTEVR